MKEKLKRFLLNTDFRLLLKNFFSLSILQGLDMILPLLTVPYLTRVIGMDKIGLLAFSSALTGYFGIIFNYGFNLTATKDISQNRDNDKQLNTIFSEVISAKLYLIFLSTLVFFSMIFLVPEFSRFSIIHVLYFFIMIFQSLFPGWYFHGVQDLKLITYLNIIVKVICTVLIFVLIKVAQDYWIQPFLILIGAIISTIVGIIYLKVIYKVKFEKQSVKSVFNVLNKGKYVFLSQLKISFFNNFNLMILGFLTNNTAVGYFSSADKILKALASLQVPIVSVLYPYFSKLLVTDKNKALEMLKRITVYGTLLYLLVLIVIFIFANDLVLLLFGNKAVAVTSVLRIMLIIPLLVFLNNLFGTQILLNLGKDKIFFKILLFTAIVNVCLIIPLTLRFSFYGTAIAVLFTETFLCVGMYIGMKKEIKKLNIDNR